MKIIILNDSNRSDAEAAYTVSQLLQSEASFIADCRESGGSFSFYDTNYILYPISNVHPKTEIAFLVVDKNKRAKDANND